MKKLLFILSFLALSFITNAQMLHCEYKTDSVVGMDGQENKQYITDTFTILFDAPRKVTITNLNSKRVWHVNCVVKEIDTNFDINSVSYNALGFQCSINDTTEMLFTALIYNSTGIVMSVGLTDVTTNSILVFFLNPKYKKRLYAKK